MNAFATASTATTECEDEVTDSTESGSEVLSRVDSTGSRIFSNKESRKVKSRDRKARKQNEQTTESPPSDVPVLRRAAMDFLARREHSFHELTQKLRTKFPDASAELVQQVLARLREQNLQSDQRFTEAYVRYRQSKGFGYLHIKSDLVRRGVPLSTINAHLYADDSAWTEIALGLIGKRLGENDKLEFGSKQHRKLSRFLETRGFSQLEIRKLLALKLA